MKRIKKSSDPGTQVLNIIVILKAPNGGILFLSSPEKHWHLPRIQMQAANLLGEFNQLFTELGLSKNLLTRNLEAIISISSLPGDKSPFAESDAVWLYSCPSSGLNVSDRYNDYKWIQAISKLNDLDVPPVYSEIFSAFENFKVNAQKQPKNLLKNVVERWF